MNISYGGELIVIFNLLLFIGSTLLIILLAIIIYQGIRINKK